MKKVGLVLVLLMLLLMPMVVNAISERDEQLHLKYLDAIDSGNYYEAEKLTDQMTDEDIKDQNYGQLAHLYLKDNASDYELRKAEELILKMKAGSVIQTNLFNRLFYAYFEREDLKTAEHVVDIIPGTTTYSAEMKDFLYVKLVREYLEQGDIETAKLVAEKIRGSERIGEANRYIEYEEEQEYRWLMPAFSSISALTGLLAVAYLIGRKNRYL